MNDNLDLAKVNSELAKIKLSAPWIIFYKQVEAFFKRDPDVEVGFNSDDYVLTIRVRSAVKAEALSKLIPQTKEFGNVTITIKIIADEDEDVTLSIIRRALDGNPIVNDIMTVKEFGMQAGFVIFNKEVVQYFNDNLTDAYGLCSTLYQDLAKDVLGEHPGIFYSTAVECCDECGYYKCD